jgi:RHS repeat-associated protein
VVAHCDMTTDGGGYTLVRVNDVALDADQNAYTKKCAALGMEVVVPQTKAHAQALYTWNGNQPANLVNVFPKTAGANSLRNWWGVCNGAPCPFWITDNGSGYTCSSSEPAGDNYTRYRLYRTGTGCGIEGTWNDATSNVGIGDYVICSTNDKQSSPPPAPSGTRELRRRLVNGCETELASSVTDCGACGNTCSAPNGTPVCNAGVCASAPATLGLRRLRRPYRHRLRDRDPRERDRTAARAERLRRRRERRRLLPVRERASSRARRASPTATHRPAARRTSSTSVAHCGGCGQACSVANGAPSCVSGLCGIETCNAGFDDCDQDDSNGCEAELATDDTNCGVCGLSCGSLPNASGVCQSGACAYVCNAGFGDCDGNVANGCETAGGCNLTCAAGTGDCDGIAANGCEAADEHPHLLRHLRHSLSGAGQRRGLLRDRSVPVHLRGRLRRLQRPRGGRLRSPAEYGRPLRHLRHGLQHPERRGACVAGTCGVGTCDAGFGDCDGLAANGCETSLTSDDDNCGACGSVCDGTCTGGLCAGTGCENPNGCAGNDPPQITSTPPTTATEGVTWYYAALGKDADGDPFTWSLAQAPAGMTIHASTGLVEWTPGPTSAGTVPVAVRATDDGGAHYTQAFAITVDGVNSAPKIVSSPPLTATAGALYAYAALATDADNPSLTWSVSGPAGMAVSSAGLVTWSVPAGTAGNFPVTLTAADGATSTQQVFSIGVSAAGDTTAPTVVITSPANDATVTEAVDLVGTITDAALGGYEVKACRHWATGGCFTLSSGFVPVSNGVLAKIDPTRLPNGTWDIVVVAKDAAGNQTQKSVALQVDGFVKPGVLRLAFTDMVVTTQTAKIEITRVYDSLDLRKTELGHGWRYDWHVGHLERPQEIHQGWVMSVCGGFIPQICVDSEYNHPVSFHMPDGRVYEFLVEVEASGALSSIHEVKPVYLELTSTGASLRAMNANFVPYSTTSYDLFETGGIIYEDFDFTEWEPSYYELTTEFGEVVTFAKNTFEVVKLKDPSGVTLDFTGPTMKVDGTNAVGITYGADGLVKTLTDASTGNTVVYTHDAAGNLVNVVTVEGATQTFAYDAQHYLTSYSTPGSNPEVYGYDDRGRISKITGPTGDISLLSYDDQGRKVTKKNAAGHSVTTEYNSLGLVTAVTDPLGRTETFTHTPGTKHLASRTDPLGHTWEYEYDARGRRTVIENPLGEKTTMTFDTKTSRILKSKDGAGREFTETTDAQGRISAFVQPDGQTVKSFAYPNATTTTVTDSQGHVQTYTFDPKGRVLTYQDAAGKTWTNAYDDAAHTQTTTNPDGTSSVAVLDPLNRPKTLTFDDGTAFGYKWGPNGSIDQVTRPDGLLHEWKRSPDGKLSEVTLDGQPIESYTYDALGRLSTQTGPNGWRAYEYDIAGQVTQILTENGSRTYGYDLAGQITSMQASNGASLLLERDAAGRITARQDAAGRRQEMGYDASGRLTQFLDELNRPLGVTYDPNGRIQQVAYPDGRTLEWTYYPSDQPVGENEPVATLKDIEGVSWAFAYDGAGRIEEITDALGGVASFEYDFMGHVTEVVDQLGRTTAMTWDGTQLAQVTSPAGKVQTWSFSPDGTTETWTRADSSVVTYTRQADSTTMSLPSGGTYVVEEDPIEGTRTELGAPAGGITIARDMSGKAQSVSLSDGASITVGYTAEGKVASTSAKAPGGQTFVTAYGYDVGGRLTQVTAPGGQDTAYEYDDAGRLTKITFPNGTSTTHTYGSASDRPSAIRHYQGATLAAEYLYTHDTNGRLTAETNPQGSFQYGYDALNRLTKIEKLSGGVVVETITSAYDAVGNVASRTDASGTTTFTYDADDRLLSANAPTGNTVYSYTGRGALSQVSGPSGTTTYAYDDLDRLTQVTLPNGDQVQYLYDVSGRLLGRVDAQGTRRCLPLPSRPDGWNDCALTYGPGGVDAEAYTFGPQGPAGQHTSAGSSYLWSAASGSVVGVVDPAGAVVGSRAYDPWGAIAQSTGAAPQHGFVGERQDPATGLVFLRARWYDPRTGRFLTPDPASGATDDSRTLHRYAYSAEDPLNKLDRSGHQFDMMSLSISMDISSTLRGIDVGIKYCVKQEIQAQLYSAVATFAAHMVESIIVGAFNAALAGTAPALAGLGAGEGLFQQILSIILCGNDPSFTLFDFEVYMGRGPNRCGDPVPRGSGNAERFDCRDNIRTRRGVTGIDIVFDGKLPIELKMDEGALDGEQLTTWCRFATKTGVHAVLYMYYEFPNDGVHWTEAKACWKCWDNAGSCSGSGHSVYVATGIKKNPSTGKRFYVPDPKSLCRPGGP